MQDFPIFDQRFTRLPGFVDLRSDTVTRPTPAMYRVMRDAPVGDDGLDGDPSVQHLEAHTASLLGKEAGLYVPTCTMANLLAVLAHTKRQQEVLLESSSHMFTTERSGSLFAGLAYTPVQGNAGAMDVSFLDAALLSGKSKLETGLVAMETSHNNSGGAVLPLEHMKKVHGLAQAAGVPVHIDGARFMNASVSLNVSPAALASHAESVSICLSKGLSAPVGAVLVGSQALMDVARRYRKMLGGTQRQAGIMAAAGLEALSSMGGRLGEDHVTACSLSSQLNEIGGLISASHPQTNIVQVHVDTTVLTSHQWVDKLKSHGVMVRPWGAYLLRCVTHRHIDDSDIKYAVDAFKAVIRNS